MEKVNQIPRPEYFLYPESRTLGFFDSKECLEAAVTELKTLGINEEWFELFEGNSGIHALDVKGQEHSVFETIARNFQKFFGTGEWVLIEQAVKELKAGHYMLSVLTTDSRMRDEVVGVMRSTGVHGIRYVTKLYTEEIEAKGTQLK